ncbi:MAG TPA: hypothetical protein VGL83_20290 [Stellaceae bacterium]
MLGAHYGSAARNGKGSDAMVEDKRKVSDDEMALRRKLAIMCRVLGMQNSIGLYGHVSVRVPDTDIVLMTPGAGSRKTRVRTDQIFVFDLAGKILTIRAAIGRCRFRRSDTSTRKSTRIGPRR